MLLMRSLVASLLVFLAVAQAYTVTIPAHEMLCFYEDFTSNQVGLKASFLFSVYSGGSFDIDYEVKDPKQSVIHSGDKEREGDFIFNIELPGEYAFCFSNKMSTVTDKVLQFEVDVIANPAHNNNNNNNNNNDAAEAGSDGSVLDSAVNKIRAHIDKVHKMQNYFKTREQRNFQTASDTESRMFWVTLIQCSVVVIVAVVQVFAVRMFFKGSKAH